MSTVSQAARGQTCSQLTWNFKKGPDDYGPSNRVVGKGFHVNVGS